MATLYQLHSSLNALESNVQILAKTWQAGDSLILLGTTAAFIDWLHAHWLQNDISAVNAIYALNDDLQNLSLKVRGNLTLADNALKEDTHPETTFTITPLTDQQWVALTRSDKFDKVITING